MEATLAPVAVARGEQAVIAIARSLVGRHTPVIGNYLRGTHPAPETLSANAVDLLEDTFAIGCAVTLARRSGQRFWRESPPPLSFSSYGVELMRWLATRPLSTAETDFSIEPRTDGDHLLAYLALDRASQIGLGGRLGAQPGIRASWLAWLGFVDQLAPGGTDDLAEHDCCVRAANPLLIELLGGEIERRWAAAELGKAAIVRVDQMAALGSAQAGVAAAFLDALDRHNRRELCRPLIDAAARIARQPIDAIEAMETTVNMEQRQRGRRGAAAFCRAMATIARWIAEARAVRFFDDDYDAAQRLLRMWETLGDPGYRRLVARADQLEAIGAAEAET